MVLRRARIYKLQMHKQISRELKSATINLDPPKTESFVIA